jgi:hypothetical protein
MLIHQFRDQGFKIAVVTSKVLSRLVLARRRSQRMSAPTSAFGGEPEMFRMGLIPTLLTHSRPRMASWSATVLVSRYHLAAIAEAFPNIVAPAR